MARDTITVSLVIDAETSQPIAYDHESEGRDLVKAFIGAASMAHTVSTTKAA